MTIASFSETYKNMSPEDKAALTELKAETEKRLGIAISLGDMLRAVTPGFDTPDALKNA
jgi:hypothetical protein